MRRVFGIAALVVAGLVVIAGAGAWWISSHRDSGLGVPHGRGQAG